MIVYIGLRVVDWWLSLDVSRTLVSKIKLLDDQQAQESFDQGKYNLELSLLPIHN